MKLFRVFLVLWLSLSVPTSALASVMSGGHCKRSEMAAATASAHGQHAMHAEMQMQGGEHAQHMAHADQAAKSGKSQCTCGCSCCGTNCAVTCSAAMVSGAIRESFFLGRDSRLIASGPTHPVAARPFDLLRPPSLI